MFSADAAYDDKKTYHRCVDLDLVPLNAYNLKRSKIKKFEQLKPSNQRKQCFSSESIKLRQQYYPSRISVERYQAILKELLQGRIVSVRSLVQVKKYIYCLVIRAKCMVWSTGIKFLLLFTIVNKNYILF